MSRLSPACLVLEREPSLVNNNNLHTQLMASSMASQDPCAYDVFLSFRGEDTRDTFTGHLYHALFREGIKVYIDFESSGGEEIWPVLYKAIEMSKISIIVLSKNYASSRLCLDELVKILECKDTKQQLVLPVFYKVDPSEVRHCTESVGEALSKLEYKFKDGMKLQRWKAALTEVANLSGFHLGNTIRDESKLIHQIVQDVSGILNHTCLKVAKHPIGIQPRVQAINSLLEVGMRDTRMIGIFGIAGIGKTATAKAIYNAIAYEFEGSCFLSNIREISKIECGIVQLQETLLSEILGKSNLKVGNIDQGIKVIKDRLCRKRVLLILDDVDQLDQLKTLSGKHDWFGLGSRIIITTRDKHLLTRHGVHLTYEVQELDHKEALQLFSWNAFKSVKPADDFVERTKDVLYHAEGVPSVLDSDLLELSKTCDQFVTKEASKSWYDIIPPNRNCVKRTFSDDMIQRVTELLKVEVRKELDKIVQQKSPLEPDKHNEDIRHLPEGNTGTNKIEAIVVDLPEGDDIVQLSPEAFINGNAVSGEVNSLPNELIVLDRHGYHLSSLPSNFHPKRLIDLRMPISLIPDVRMEHANFTVLNLSSCKLVTKIPNLSRQPNLKELILSFCTNLEEIHDSVGLLDKLVRLDLCHCKQLKEILELPQKIEEVHARGCISLESFPQVLKKFQFDTSDDSLDKLIWLDLSRCHKMLKKLINPVLSPSLCRDLIGPVYAGQEIPTSWFSLLEDYVLDGIADSGRGLPTWFSHSENSLNANRCRIYVDWQECSEEAITIALCAVFVFRRPSRWTPEMGKVNASVVLEGLSPSRVEGTTALIGNESTWGPQHLFLAYTTVKPSELKGNHLEVKFSASADAGAIEIASCEVHRVDEHKERVKARKMRNVNKERIKTKDGRGVLGKGTDVQMDLSKAEPENLLDLLSTIQLYQSSKKGQLGKQYTRLIPWQH